TRVCAAVGEIVRRQVTAGVDLVSDGEQGKVGYSNYVRHRLTGLRRTRPPASDAPSLGRARPDWADFPEAAKREPRSNVSRPSCTGPIEWKDREAVGWDIANFQGALAGSGATEGFMTAASPGVIAHFLRNEHYP